MNSKNVYRKPKTVCEGHLHEPGEKTRRQNRELKNTNRQLQAAVNARQKTRLQIESIKKEWEVTFDAMVDWVCLLDRDCTIIRTNRRGEELCKTPLRKMIGRRCCEILHGPENRIPACPLPEALKTSQRESVELQLADGRWMMISIDPIVDANNGLLNVVHICRDITERKMIEIEREKLVRELRAALADVKNP